MAFAAELFPFPAGRAFGFGAGEPGKSRAASARRKQADQAQQPGYAQNTQVCTSATRDRIPHLTGPLTTEWM